MRADIIKHFKMACIAYAPSSVIFRNIEFKRAQILVFRKFLMGQCSKIVHLKEPYKSLAMSTKRIFDDMYLYLKELNIKSLDKDPLNDMPQNSYEDMAARYWNLIYKDSVARSPNQKEPFTLKDVDLEFENKKLFEFGINADAFRTTNASAMGVGSLWAMRDPYPRFKTAME